MDEFYVLVVEDDSGAQDQLTKLLRKAVPESVVESAGSVVEGHEKISQALLKGLSYDLAILDFKLPRMRGEHAENVDESVCQRLAANMPDTVIGHVTGFGEDRRITTHIGLVHSPERKRGFFLSKLDPDFASKLVQSAREVLYGARIEREISDLLASGRKPQPAGESARFTGPRRYGSLSNRLLNLRMDVSASWGYLGLATKAYVQKYFEVREGPDETPNGVSVTPR